MQRSTTTFVRSAFLGVLLLLLAAGAPLAAGESIPAGVDLWATASAGRTYTSFAGDPIPADFFCPGSKPFTGRIAFRGVPVEVEPAGSLGGADTIVRRLDEARFDDNGVAVTRIQLMALSLAAEESIETECGRYAVTARLHGEQPTTTMRILKTEVNGGTYEAPLALDVRLVFTPVEGNSNGRRELTRRVELGPSNNAVWTFGQNRRYTGRVVVDTDGDGRPETSLPKDTHFVAGIAPAATGAPVTATPCKIYGDATSCPAGYCLHEACHCNPYEDEWDPYDPGEGCTYLHCLWVCVRCIHQDETGGGVTTTP